MVRRRDVEQLPYFAQKKIVAVSSMDRGLFVLRPQVGGGGKR